MPKDGFTALTVSVNLRDQLKRTAKERGYKSIPELLKALCTSTNSECTSTEIQPKQPSFPKRMVRGVGFAPKFTSKIYIIIKLKSGMKGYLFHDGDITTVFLQNPPFFLSEILTPNPNII